MNTYINLENLLRTITAKEVFLWNKQVSAMNKSANRSFLVHSGNSKDFGSNPLVAHYLDATVINLTVSASGALNITVRTFK